jgi:hypothetical protein
MLTRCSEHKNSGAVVGLGFVTSQLSSRRLLSHKARAKSPSTVGSGVSLDCEGIFLTDDGFWISDEYGPYVYQFDHDGNMLQAIRPPDAILPLRKGVVNFSANSPPRYDPTLKPSPGNPTQGRQNNQGSANIQMQISVRA